MGSRTSCKKPERVIHKATLVLWYGCLLALYSPSSGWCAGEYPTKYDRSIQAAVEQWWTDLPFWKLWKAQLVAESNLDPNARSGVGAGGLAQIMPTTFHDLSMTLRYPDNASPFDADYAIQAGAYYQGRLRRAWSPAGRTPPQRNDLGLGSYNAGMGHILAAQRRCHDAVVWVDISPCLAEVTGADNARQTTTYVSRINRIWQAMEATR